MDPDLLNKARFYVPQPPRRKQSSVPAFKVKKPKTRNITEGSARVRSFGVWLGCGATVVSLLFCSASYDVLRKPTSREVDSYLKGFYAKTEQLEGQCYKKTPNQSNDVTTVYINDLNLGPVSCGNFDQTRFKVTKLLKTIPVMPVIVFKTESAGAKSFLAPVSSEVIAGPYSSASSQLRRLFSSALRVVGLGKLERSPSL